MAAARGTPALGAGYAIAAATLRGSSTAACRFRLPPPLKEIPGPLSALSEPRRDFRFPTSGQGMSGCSQQIILRRRPVNAIPDNPRAIAIRRLHAPLVARWSSGKRVSRNFALSDAGCVAGTSHQNRKTNRSAGFPAKITARPPPKNINDIKANSHGVFGPRCAVAAEVTNAHTWTPVTSSSGVASFVTTLRPPALREPTP